MDPQRGVCLGCARTLDEIARWSAMNDIEREEVLLALPARKAALPDSASTTDGPAR
jgi:predicted Fe-S protein YdhL (DUF1289 family)